MRRNINQGDILKIEKINKPVLVVSNDLINQTGMIMGCQIWTDAQAGPLHIKISNNDIEGYVICELVKLIDLNVRGCSCISKIEFSDIQNISDAIQGMFDYVYIP